MEKESPLEAGVGWGWGGGLDEADSSKGRKGWGVEGVGVGEREGSERARTSSY